MYSIALLAWNEMICAMNLSQVSINDSDTYQVLNESQQGDSPEASSHPDPPSEHLSCVGIPRHMGNSPGPKTVHFG